MLILSPSLPLSVFVSLFSGDEGKGKGGTKRGEVGGGGGGRLQGSLLCAQI